MTSSLNKKKRQVSCMLDMIKESWLTTSRHNAGFEEKPVAILWADADKQWQPVVDKLRLSKVPLITLGAYDPHKWTGPAIWIKCVVDGTIDIGLSKDEIPIIYLPEVNRQMLRTATECPFHLEPLIELQYRGVVWTQQNGKDWSIEAFLVSKDGLDLDVAKDEATRRSIYASLSVLAETPLSRLEGRRLESEDFDRLMIGDQPRDMLEWMSDPETVRAQWGDGRWHAFCSRCKEDFKFDPEIDGVIVAAERMGIKKQDVWKQLWARFSEAPAHYPGVEDLLLKAKPSGVLLYDPEPWPDENETAEIKLRADLQLLAGATLEETRQRILELEKEHGLRREWVWAKLGRSPLAKALQHLVIIAQKSFPIRGASFDELAKNYSSSGSETDAALLNALTEGKSLQDKTAINSAARALYFPWVLDITENFQKFITTTHLPNIKKHDDYQVDFCECVVFVDGLRFDLGQKLQAMLDERGLKVNLGHSWAGVPTVTASAKPASSPINSKIGLSLNLPETFSPVLSITGQELNTARFRKLLEEDNFQIIGEDEAGDPEGKGWTEFGAIDRRGHDLGLDLARQLVDQLEGVVERVMFLFESGWKTIRIITDHGWLLMPGGLPKTDLPGYLVESRWSRCAVIKGQSKVSVPTAPWYWNPDIDVAISPGISTFKANEEYAHGGISIQECLTPVLIVRSSKEMKKLTANIKSIQWIGLRCRIKVVLSEVFEIKVDIRSKANSPETSVIETIKGLDENGQVSLMIPDEDKIGTAVSVVILDNTGNVLSREMTTIGGDQV